MEVSPLVFSYKYSLFPASGLETKQRRKSSPTHFGTTAGPKSNHCIEAIRRTTVAGAPAPAGGFRPIEQHSIKRPQHDSHEPVDPSNRSNATEAFKMNPINWGEQMPAIRICKNCGQKNRIAANHLADTGRCGACKTPLPPLDEPMQVDTALFDEIVQNARVPILVDFCAAWCGPCRPTPPAVAPTAKDLACR